MRRALHLTALAATGATCTALSAAADSYDPAPNPLPNGISLLTPSTIPHADLRVRNGCWYFVNRAGEIEPWDFLGLPNVPYCGTGLLEPPKPPSAQTNGS